MAASRTRYTLTHEPRSTGQAQVEREAHATRATKRRRSPAGHANESAI